MDVPAFRNAAHHIVAGTAKRAQEARMVLERFNIGINDAINGVFLPIEKGVSQATYHPTLHTNVYYEAVNSLLSGCTSEDEVYEVLKYIAEELLNGRFPH